MEPESLEIQVNSAKGTSGSECNPWLQVTRQRSEYDLGLGPDRAWAGLASGRTESADTPAAGLRRAQPGRPRPSESQSERQPEFQ